MTLGSQKNVLPAFWLHMELHGKERREQYLTGKAIDHVI